MVERDLQELVDSPAETLGAEYKDWLDLDNDTVARANLARHIAALCNFGGGSIVLGFADTLEPSGENPFGMAVYSRDKISSISKKYLDPAVPCDVRQITSALGNVHVVILVPGHGATPICSKAGGPDSNGKPKGIAQGVYYVRKTGPESAPVTSPADWAPIVRRCALHDRAAILSALGAALEPSAPAPQLTDALERWHSAARPPFEQGVRDGKAPELILRSNEQLSYAIERADDEQFDPAILKTIARELNVEIRTRVNTGWSMFYPFERDPIAPFMNSDRAAGTGDDEFLEADLWEVDGSRSDAEMWRISSDGRATLLRPIRGDFPSFPPPGWVAGRWFSPNLLVQDLGEIVRHAEAHSSRFRSPTRVALRCEFRGLRGREIGHPGRSWRPGRVARTDERVVSGTWPVTALATDWPRIVAALAQPVFRCFDADLQCTPEWVEHEAQSWRPMGAQYP